MPEMTAANTAESVRSNRGARSNAAQALRIFYASGPGDNIGTYRHWKEQREDPGEPVVAYSGQFYSLCRDRRAQAFVLSTCARRDLLEDGSIRIEHRPFTGRNRKGAGYHLAQFWYGLGLIGSVLRFRADVAIINEGAHWFMLTLLSWAGVRVVPSLHVRLDWQGRNGMLWGLINRLNSRFFRRHCAAILVASGQIADDVYRLARTRQLPVLEFLPLYRRVTFERIKPADHDRRPFNVLFAGRVEPNKGVFDLFDAARQVWSAAPDVHFHVCGTGSALQELRARVVAAGEEARFQVHGYCDQARMAEMYDLAHTVVVPTRSDFGEGFNQVTAEGILAGRPVITSAVCPAIAYVQDAVVEVPPDDVAAYARAILRLAGDRDFYVRTHRACLEAQEQFYDPTRSWGAVVARVLGQV